MLDRYHRRGGHHLASRVLDYLNWRCKQASHRFIDWYRDHRGGTHAFEIGGLTCEFEATSTHGGPAIRRQTDREYRAVKDLLGELRPDDIVYDVGANLGLYTCFAAQAVRNGEVIAFEPYPPNARQLARNVDINGLDNVRVEAVALSDAAARVEFSAPERDIAGFATGRLRADGGSAVRLVDTQSVDEEVRAGRLPQPTVIKIDVEGAERAVIDGMRGVLSDPACRTVYVEYHTEPGDDDVALYRILDTLVPLGYDVEVLDVRGLEIGLKATRQPA